MSDDDEQLAVKVPLKEYEVMVKAVEALADMRRGDKIVVDKFLVRLSEFVRLNWNADVKELVIGINRRVIGACNYYQWSSAHKEFRYLAYRLWHIMWQWAKRRHPHRGAKWLKNHYWKRNGQSGREFSFQGLSLVDPSKLTVKWWTRPQVRTFSSPFDPAEIEYWNKRIPKWKYCGTEYP